MLIGTPIWKQHCSISATSRQRRSERPHVHREGKDHTAKARKRPVQGPAATVVWTKCRICCIGHEIQRTAEKRTSSRQAAPTCQQHCRLAKYQARSHPNRDELDSHAAPREGAYVHAACFRTNVTTHTCTELLATSVCGLRNSYREIAVLQCDWQLKSASTNDWQQRKIRAVLRVRKGHFHSRGVDWRAWAVRPGNRMVRQPWY